jgi:DNA-binding transcriptional LysR family regulator
LDWSDLEGVPWILPVRGSSTYMHLESLLLRHDLRIPRGSVESGSWRGSAGILQTNIFLALFPMAYAQKFLQTQNLTVLPLSTEGIQAKIQAVWRNDDESALIPMLVDTVRQAYARL